MSTTKGKPSPAGEAQQHTAGPWHIEHKGIELWVMPADLLCGVRGVSEDEANAALVAAAPEIAEALRNLLDMVTDNRTHGPEVYAAAAALRKAGRLG